MKLTKEEMIEAFEEGVRRAICELATDSKPITDAWGDNGILLAIQKGVCDAVWKIGTHATDMPCNDFYDSIKHGVKEALADMDFSSMDP